MTAALTATLERRAGAIDPLEFEFISTEGQLQQARRFAETLLDVLLR